MEKFTRLFCRLDETNRTGEKVLALEEYFTSAEPADAAWALFFLSGRKIKRAVPTRHLSEWAAKESATPIWLLSECYEAVGDLAETVALLLPEHQTRTERPLHALVEEKLLPLPEMSEEARRLTIVGLWREMSSAQRLVWNKLITGSFRVGVAKTLVVRALAGVAGVSQAEMTHRVLRFGEPNAEEYRRLFEEQPRAGAIHPYPFFLAHPLETLPEELGSPGDWIAEWKWDGIRGQLVKRRGEIAVWSRGEELVTDTFPEMRLAGSFLPDGTVLDGELLAWNDDRPMRFQAMQRRLGRKATAAGLQGSVPVVFMAYDLLEEVGEDLRPLPLEQRRARLEKFVSSIGASKWIKLSPRVAFADWSELAAIRAQARERAAEGLMLKRRDSPYRVGRVRGDWWKWKVDPYQIDAVLINAQPGHGKRASLFTDYTFGVWDQGELVPVAKAYSGLTDAEIREVDRFVRQHTRDRFGPVRVVEPQLVFELHFAGLQASGRHKSGVAVRFPRIGRWRRDKKPDEADTLETVKALLAREQSDAA